MHNTKLLLAAASLMALSALDVGTANAQPLRHEVEHRPMARQEIIVRHDTVRHETLRRDFAHRDFNRPLVVRERVYDTLRFHRFRGLGEPFFSHGRYVVRSSDRFGRVVLVEIDPRTGAFLGVI